MRRGAAVARLQLDVSGSAAALRAAPASSALRLWASAALGRAASGAQLALRVVGETESRRLNRQYRGHDKSTNILSFPAPRLPLPDAAGGRSLGDLVICAPVLRREARAQHKPLRAHWAHLVVHGCLHLIGHDHTDDAEAQTMERRERRVLRALGFSDPYRSGAQA